MIGVSEWISIVHEATADWVILKLLADAGNVWLLLILVVALCGLFVLVCDMD